MKKKLTSILIAVLVLSCSSDDGQLPIWVFTQKIQTKTFEIDTPKGWELIEGQGIDTYIGEIKNDKLTIFFEQGHLSFGTLENIQESDKTIYFKRLEINGVPAIIHKERTGDSSSDTRLSVYLDSGEKQNRLYVLNPDNEFFFIELFKTHNFLN